MQPYGLALQAVLLLAGCGAESGTSPARPDHSGTGGASGGVATVDGGTAGSAGAAVAGGGSGPGGTTGGSGSAGAGANPGGAGSGGKAEALTPLETAEELGRSIITNTSYSASGVPKDGEYLYAGAMGGTSLTYRGYQYVTYYEANGKVTVARRDLGQSPALWEKSVVPGYTVTTDDRHNKMTSAVSRGDGTIHVAFDHHTAPAFHYARTRSGVADHPASQPWNDQVFSYEENLNRDDWFSGTFPERTVTYPSFLEVGDTVMLYWRSGGQAQGRMNLAQYDASSHQWDQRRTFTSEKGVYREGNWSSDSRGPYHAGFVLDPQGNLHISWLWRERDCTQPGVHYCNHGLYYAWSDDLGVTWRDTEGKVVGGVSTPLSVENVRPIWALGVGFDASNTGLQSRWVAGSKSFEVYVDHEATVGGARGTYRYSRSAEGVWSQTKVDKTPGGLGIEIPAGGPGSAPNQTWDFARLESEGIATVVFQVEPATRGVPTPLHVVDYRFAK